MSFAVARTLGGVTRYAILHADGEIAWTKHQPDAMPFSTEVEAKEFMLAKEGVDISDPAYRGMLEIVTL